MAFLKVILNITIHNSFTLIFMLISMSIFSQFHSFYFTEKKDLPILRPRKVVSLKMKRMTELLKNSSKSIRKHNCTKCGRSYKMKGDLSRHQRFECGRKPSFGCPYCSKCCNHEFHLRNHIRRIHPTKEAYVINISHAQS